MTGPRPTEPTRAILNIDEAAQLLSVSTKTFAKVLRDGEVPGRKIGREWKFSRQALIDWVGSSKSREFLGVHDDEDEELDTTTPLVREIPPKPRSTLPRRGDAEMSVEED